ncbi:sensor domain-containing diguanylate cyclase [Atlantibacter hermannii]|uniref:sensor domain-containing diguanylate cyclase n=1 Tax=Atlantibacter hermannii TaxID=565 RepID=UPI0028A1B673|nr:diguanylate cyclase [Atlantibacter hermannii]
MIFPDKPPNETERLKSLYLIDLLDKNNDERFDRLTRLMKLTFHVPISALNLLDRERQWVLSGAGIDIRETPRNTSFCAHAILAEGVFVVKDALKDKRFRDNPYVKDKPHVRFYAGYPVRLPDGMIAGTLCIVDHVPRDFSMDDANALIDFAAIVEDEFLIISKAMSDNVTDLMNKQSFLKLGQSRFEKFTKYGLPFSLIYFEIDNIKSIRDVLGDREADIVLKNFSAYIKSTLKKHDIGAYLGQGNFAVLIEHDTANADEQYLFNLQCFMDDINKKSTKAYHINYGYGMTNYDPADHRSLLMMLESASRTTYAEKRRKEPQ